MASGLLYGKNLVQSHFWVIFGTSILNNSCNRLKYVFWQANFFYSSDRKYIFKTNKNMKFYFIWKELVHFTNVSLN